MSEEMQCARPPCPEKEDRIDGYCSVYCRDVHELEAQLETTQRELGDARAERDKCRALNDRDTGTIVRQAEALQTAREGLREIAEIGDRQLGFVGSSGVRDLRNKARDVLAQLPTSTPQSQSAEPQGVRGEGPHPHPRHWKTCRERDCPMYDDPHYTWECGTGHITPEEGSNG